MDKSIKRLTGVKKRDIYSTVVIDVVIYCLFETINSVGSGMMLFEAELIYRCGQMISKDYFESVLKKF